MNALASTLVVAALVAQGPQDRPATPSEKDYADEVGLIARKVSRDPAFAHYLPPHISTASEFRHGWGFGAAGWLATWNLYHDVKFAPAPPGVQVALQPEYPKDDSLLLEVFIVKRPMNVIGPSCDRIFRLNVEAHLDLGYRLQVRGDATALRQRLESIICETDRAAH